MSDPVLQVSAALGVVAAFYLVYICHQMDERQERAEQYITVAIRMGTVMAGGAAISPLMSFLQQPHVPPRRAHGS